MFFESPRCLPCAKSFSALSILVVVSALLLSTIVESSAGWTDCMEHFIDGFFPSYLNNSVGVCRNRTFAISYDTEMWNPTWSAYHITRDDTRANIPGRVPSFKKDPDLTALGVSSPSTSNPAYSSLWNRGHLAPSQIMSYTDQAKAETYYTSNVAPQWWQFNQQTWQNLEETIFNWVNKSSNPLTEVYIITGIGYRDRSNITKVSNVAFPSYYFCALCDPLTNESVAFLGLNEEDGGGLLETYRTVDDVAGTIFCGATVNSTRGTSPSNTGLFQLFPPRCRTDRFNEANWNFPGFSNYAFVTGANCSNGTSRPLDPNAPVVLATTAAPGIGYGSNASSSAGGSGPGGNATGSGSGSAPPFPGPGGFNGTNNTNASMSGSGSNTSASGSGSNATAANSSSNSSSGSGSGVSGSGSGSNSNAEGSSSKGNSQGGSEAGANGGSSSSSSSSGSSSSSSSSGSSSSGTTGSGSGLEDFSGDSSAMGPGGVVEGTTIDKIKANGNVLSRHTVRLSGTMWRDLLKNSPRQTQITEAIRFALLEDLYRMFTDFNRTMMRKWSIKPVLESLNVGSLIAQFSVNTSVHVTSGTSAFSSAVVSLQKFVELSLSFNARQTDTSISASTTSSNSTITTKKTNSTSNASSSRSTTTSTPGSGSGAVAAAQVQFTATQRVYASLAASEKLIANESQADSVLQIQLTSNAVAGANNTAVLSRGTLGCQDMCVAAVSLASLGVTVIIASIILLMIGCCKDDAPATPRRGKSKSKSEPF